MDLTKADASKKRVIEQLKEKKSRVVNHGTRWCWCKNSEGTEVWNSRGSNEDMQYILNKPHTVPEDWEVIRLNTE